MISAIVYGALKSLVSDRCYPSTFPQPPAVPTWPAIRYTISSDAIPDICGTDDGSTDNVSVQIDYVAKTYGAVDALRAMGRAALMATDPPCTRENGFETFDTETKTHRFVDIYQFHPSSASS